MLIIAVILTFLMMAVMITDVTRYIIPNRIVAVIVLLYPFALYLSPTPLDWKMALIVAGGTFIIGFILFVLNVMGGGDIKLLTAIALFVGKSGFPEFIMGVALFGGALALFLLIVRPVILSVLAKRGAQADALPKVFMVDAPVPYGLAIAAYFLIMLWSGRVPGIGI